MDGWTDDVVLYKDVVLWMDGRRCFIRMGGWTDERCFIRMGGRTTLFYKDGWTDDVVL